MTHDKHGEIHEVFVALDITPDARAPLTVPFPASVNSVQEIEEATLDTQPVDTEERVSADQDEMRQTRSTALTAAIRYLLHFEKRPLSGQFPLLGRGGGGVGWGGYVRRPSMISVAQRRLKCELLWIHGSHSDVKMTLPVKMSASHD